MRRDDASNEGLFLIKTHRIVIPTGAKRSGGTRCFSSGSVGEPIKNILNKLAFTGLRPELAGPIRESFLFGGRGTPGFQPMKPVHFDHQVVSGLIFERRLPCGPSWSPS
jgi:hypothetical protein